MPGAGTGQGGKGGKGGKASSAALGGEYYFQEAAAYLKKRGGPKLKFHSPEKKKMKRSNFI